MLVSAALILRLANLSRALFAGPLQPLKKLQAFGGRFARFEVGQALPFAFFCAVQAPDPFVKLTASV
jgi:hypothetical protein